MLELKVFRLTKDVQPDVHFYVAEIRLRFVGAEHAIPPREVETVIGVRLVHVGRVVDSVHVRGHHQEAKDSVKADRESDIGVIEQRAAIKKDRKDYHGTGGRAEQEYGAEFYQYRE